MREILFRGKCVDNGKWVEGYLSFVYIDVPEKARIYSPTKVRSFDVITETVGQYTGLCDKNGTRIFEHDIVRIAVCGTYDNYVVSYDKKNARFVVGDRDFTMVRIFSPKIEVIGNIHDNPELLEGDA